MSNTKVCGLCKETRPIGRFSTYDNGYGVRTRGSCKDCKNNKVRGTRKESSRRYHEKNKDKLNKKSMEYYSDNREERKRLSREYYSKNKELVRNKVSASTYGITVEEVIKLKDRGKCDICGDDGTSYEKGLHIDHCHKTKEVRGLLCHSCNVGLGLFKDDVDLMDKAKEYLNANK